MSQAAQAQRYTLHVRSLERADRRGDPGANVARRTVADAHHEDTPSANPRQSVG